VRKVIHLDNSRFFRKLVARFLTGRGFDVESFDNWDDAAMSIAGAPPDLIVTGLALTDCDGPELIEDITGAFLGPVIVMSSDIDKDQDNELVDTLKTMGVMASIPKSGGWPRRLGPLLDCLDELSAARMRRVRGGTRVQ
jgi:DNA-binding NtrC family response regulator